MSSWLLLIESRLLSKLGYDEKFLGEVQASTAGYLDVFEDTAQL